MIDDYSLSAEWLAEKRKKYSKDPGIMESMIYALYLLEQLKLTGLDFIFKGGTSLILLMEQPARFSVDIDIIVNPETDREKLESYLSKIVDSSAFVKMQLDERRSYKTGVPKAHYRFAYTSNTSANQEREILLDVLFAENHYPVLLERPIETEWLIPKGNPLTVPIPDINSIAGDKLTAFAPNTIGVPYYRERTNDKGEVIKSDMFKEIIKQVFDIGHLFDSLNNLNTFSKSYKATASGEIKYRPENTISIEQVLKDTFETAILIAKRDTQINAEDKEKFANLNVGIKQFGYFVFLGHFRIEDAQVASAKAAYLASIILTNYNGELNKFDSKMAAQDYRITHPDYNFLNKKLRFVANGEALFYWNESVKLIHQTD